MCRNIKRLRHADHPPTDAELHDAALQFVRKISGFHAPSSVVRDPARLQSGIDARVRRPRPVHQREPVRECQSAPVPGATVRPDS